MIPFAPLAMSTDTLDRFAFGKNWQAFLTELTDERVERAKKSLVDFLEVRDLSGKTFIDIGCGSGLFSYAACALGAKRIVSFDFDEHFVAATRSLWERAGKPKNWTVEQGSVLDTAYLEALGKFDIVYSWGVLHHTGDMWTAIRNATKCVAPGGHVYIALYNNVEGRFGSRFWWHVKYIYNRSPRFVQVLMEWMYILVYHIVPHLLRGKNPVRAAREYGAARGMHWKKDIVDWLGGFPYEYATPGEVFQFMKREFPHLTLVNLKTRGGIGNNWFLFRDGGAVR